MNARNLFATLVALLLLGASVAEARVAVGTAKARGVFNEFSAQHSVARSRPTYRYQNRAPAVQSAPMMAQAPTAPAAAPQVAQAPVEARRFSYAPAPAVNGSVPCPQGTATASAPAVNGARRFSYAPAPEASVAPAPTYAPRVYSTRPSYSGRSRGGWTNPQFPLLKTDPQKYNTR